jgi:serine/threonine protein kinase
LIPSTILFIASDAIDISSRISLVDGDFCPEFDRWLQLRRSNIAIDFRRIQRVGFGLKCLRDYVVNLSIFEEKSMICESNEVPNEIYHRTEDEFSIVVKSMAYSESVRKSEIENELENLINLHHPCISGLIGFVFPIESDNQHELKIVRMYFEGCSLSEVLSLNPIWLTSTIKAKVVAGIVLGLRFAHSLGLIHGHLTTNNILFDSNHCIQIVDFNPILLTLDGNEDKQMAQLGNFSREQLTLVKDIEAFSLILFELLFGRRPNSETPIPTDIPDFVSSIIKSGLHRTSETRYRV